MQKVWGAEMELLPALQPLRSFQNKNIKIWGFHGGDYEEWRLLECYAVWLL
jgi:hypothetical protein